MARLARKGAGKGRMSTATIAAKFQRLDQEQRAFVLEVIDRILECGEPAEQAIEFVRARREFAALATP